MIGLACRVRLVWQDTRKPHNISRDGPAGPFSIAAKGLLLAGNTRLAYSSATRVQVIDDGKYLLEPGRLVNIYLSNHRLNKLLMSIVIPRQ